MCLWWGQSWVRASLKMAATICSNLMLWNEPEPVMALLLQLLLSMIWRCFVEKSCTLFLSQSPSSTFHLMMPGWVFSGTAKLWSTALWFTWSWLYKSLRKTAFRKQWRQIAGISWQLSNLKVFFSTSSSFQVEGKIKLTGNRIISRTSC